MFKKQTQNVLQQFKTQLTKRTFTKIVNVSKLNTFKLFSFGTIGKRKKKKLTKHFQVGVSVYYSKNSFVEKAECSTAASNKYEFPTKKLKQASKDKKAVVLVACGSFNPPTMLHLRLFESAKDHLENNLGLDVIGGFMSPVNDKYGKKGLLPGKHRAEMAKRCDEDSTWISFDPWELEQKDWSRTRVALEHFDRMVKKNQLYPENVRVLFICGADLLDSFNVPGLWLEEDQEEILKKYGICALDRAGTKSIADIMFSNELMYKYRKNIYIMPNLINNDVSSTKVRLFTKRGFSIKYLVPDEVAKYIHDNNLYK